MQLVNIINYYKQHGFLKLMKRILNRLGFSYYNHSFLFLHADLKNIAKDFEGPGTFQIAAKDDIQKERNYYDGWYTKERDRDRLNGPHLLLILKVDDKITTYQWLVFKKVKINWLEMNFEITRDFVYHATSYIIPELRRTGIASKTNKEALYYLKKEGFTHLFCVINPDNSASINKATKVGYKEYQRINYR